MRQILSGGLVSYRTGVLVCLGRDLTVGAGKLHGWYLKKCFYKMQLLIC